MNVLLEVTDVFRSVFDRPALIIRPSTSATDVEGWDSYMHINLIVALEERFGVSFTTKELGEMKCVGDLINLLAAKGVHG